MHRVLAAPHTYVTDTQPMAESIDGVTTINASIPSQNSQHLWHHPYRLQAPLNAGPHLRGAPPLNILAHIDRIGYRVPESCNDAFQDCNHATNSNRSQATKKNKLQRSLTPHVDCCPTDMLSQRRWRPIQCMLALTPTLQVSPHSRIFSPNLVFFPGRNFSPRISTLILLKVITACNPSQSHSTAC